MKTNLLIASGIAVTALAAKYIYNRFFNPYPIIPKQLVIQKLIQTRQHLYPILYEISYFIAQQLVPKGISPTQAKALIIQNQQNSCNFLLLLKQEVGFKQSIQQIFNSKIYNDMDMQALQYAIEYQYKDDREVQYYKKAFQEQYQKCFLGIQPSMETILITIVKKNQLLEIIQTMLKGIFQLIILLKIDKLFRLKQIRSLCVSNQNNKIDSQQLQRLIISSEQNDDEMREKIIRQNRLGSKKNMQILIGRFLKQDRQFKIKYEQIIKNYEQNVEKILI